MKKRHRTRAWFRRWIKMWPPATRAWGDSFVAVIDANEVSCPEAKKSPGSQTWTGYRRQESRLMDDFAYYVLGRLTEFPKEKS